MGSTSSSTHEDKYALLILFTRVAVYTSEIPVSVVYTHELVLEIKV